MQIIFRIIPTLKDKSRIIKKNYQLFFVITNFQTEKKVMRKENTDDFTRDMSEDERKKYIARVLRIYSEKLAKAKNIDLGMAIKETEETFKVVLQEENENAF